MTKLYVANTSRQNAQFVYRLPNMEVTRRAIPAGKQELMYDGELTFIEEIIRQAEQYGMKPAEEVTRTKSFVGLAYRIDKPITVEQFMIADDVNYDALADFGQEIRRNAALYAGAVTEATAKMTGDEVKKSSIVIRDVSKENPEFDEIYSAERPDGVAPARPRGRRKRD